MPYENLKFMVEAEKNPSQRILDSLWSSKRKSFLVFGKAMPLLSSLIAEGWSGIVVDPTPVTSISTIPGLKHLTVTIGPDVRFKETLDGYWTRVTTVQELYDQFGGDYDLIAAVNTGVDRLIWYSEQVQASLPKVYLLFDDGHQEDVIEWAGERGYKSYLSGDWLVMVHE